MKEILLISCFLLTGLTGNLQDHVITWQGDTLDCRFPENPRKEGLRPAYKYHNGHIRLMAVFTNDSVRALEAGQVRGYYRENMEKGFYVMVVLNPVRCCGREIRIPAGIS